MTFEEINKTLKQLFPDETITVASDSWQIESPDFRMLILLSTDQSWLRSLVPIVPAQSAAPFLSELLEANFDATQEVRYAIHQDVLWGVFQHSMAGLAPADFAAAIQRLLVLKQQGIDACFTQLIEKRVRQIISLAKQQGQSMEATLQTLDHFYEEGMMGDMSLGAGAKEETLAAWRYQLERLWNEVE